MIDTALDRLIRFAIRHERALSIMGGVWFAVSCAITARFIPVPEMLEIPYVTDRNSWAASGAWNVIWWGFAHPAIEARHKAIAAEGDEAEDKPG